MSTCVLEHCSEEGQTREINFRVHDETAKKYHANVAMCPACHKELWRRKREGTANYDVLFRPDYVSTDIMEVKHFAKVEAMRLK